VQAIAGLHGGPARHRETEWLDPAGCGSSSFVGMAGGVTEAPFLAP
jgi:hypothetical protein